MTILSQAERPRAAFTLVELLVVVAIIVILLALLAGGLTQALKAAEKSRCLTNQRNIAQALNTYRVASNGTFPNSIGLSPTATSVGGSQGNIGGTGAGVGGSTTSDRICFSPEYRSSDPTTGRLAIQGGATGTGNQSQQQQTDAASVNGRTALGLGILAATDRLPQGKLGDAAHCPSLDTSTAVTNANGIAGTPRYGMDEVHNEGAGGSYWLAPDRADARIVGSFHYRGMSYGRTRGSATMRENLAKADFVMTSDLFDRRYGIRFHHVTGYNVAYGDGHAEFFADPDQKIETQVIGDNANYKSDTASPNDQKDAVINGYAKPGADEAVFKYMSRAR